MMLPSRLGCPMSQKTPNMGNPGIETSVTVRIPPDETTELSSDATLSALTLTGMELEKTGGLHAVVEGFDSTHLSYAASVANSVSQTTVAPTVNHSGATYVINLNGVTDEDGVISLSVGSNIITIEVTAEDGETTRTYTVAVTRADAVSTDATLSGLTLSGIDFGTFASGTTSYTASVANTVSQTTVTPTVNHSGAEYVTKLDGVDDADGVVSLSVGSNVITVEVTAEDDETTQTYTVTVTRAENALPTGVPTISGTAQVGQTLTVDTSGIADEDGLTNASFGATWTANEGYLRVLIAPGRDLSYTVSRRDVGMTLEVQVNFEDDAGERHFVTSAKTALVAATSPAAPENFATSVTDSGDVTLSWDAPAWDLAGEIGGEQTWGDGGSPITGYVVQWKEASVSWDTEADVSEATVTGTSHTVEGLTVGTDYTTRVIAINAVGRGIPSDEKTVTVTRPASTDATLSALTLSGIDFGTFTPGTTSYTAQVANSVSQTTVTPTVNDSRASYVIKLGGVTDVDGVVSLSLGSNVITIVVTAEDDSTTRTYSVTVTRAEPVDPERLSSDAKLSALTLSGIDFGTFDSTTTSYTARVANSVTETTVTPTVSHSGATYVIKLGGVTDADGVVPLDVGANVITIEVTAEDGNTAQTYTVTVTRAAPPSTDATLSVLTLSGVDFGTFAAGTTSYTAEVANSVSQTTVSPTTNHSRASYVIKLDGASDADGVVTLGVGSNVITVEVTAQDGQATRNYTVTVTRAAELSSDATLSDLTLSGIDFGTFDPTTTSYRARVAGETTETTVTPTVNHSAASYVIKLGGLTDTDGVVSLSEGSNVITVDVTAEDGETILTYTVTVARGPSPCVTGGAVSDSTNTGLVSDCDALLAVKDTLAGTASLNWSADTLIARWEGLTLLGTPERVAGLNLINESLDGVIPSELGDLSMLVKLDLRSNQLSGSIPGSLGRLSRLTTLNLRSNQLGGSIPGSLGRLTRLTVLNLHSNDLGGDMPDLSRTMLEELYLANNYDDMVEGSGLTGPVPAWLNDVTNMRELWLWGNRLSGTIPDLSGMTSLQKLKLAGNNLTGGIPAVSELPPNLKWLIINSNPLGGAIPDLSGMTSLTHLWLHSNELTGSIPAGDMLPPNVDDLNLRDNMLAGQIPDLSGLDMATRVRLHNNMLSGEVPATLGGLDRLRQLWLHGNQLTSIAAELGDLSDTLIEIALSSNSWTEAACVPAALANVATNDYAEAGLEICESNDGS